MSTTATTTKWPGTTEQRDLRRVQKTGLYFMTGWRAGTHNDWFELVKGRTRLRDRWIWAEKHLTDQAPALERLRAEVAGTIILARFADASQSSASQSWFNLIAAQDDYAEGWYFDDECLEVDGWIQTEGTTPASGNQKATTWKGWRKPEPKPE